MLKRKFPVLFNFKHLKHLLCASVYKIDCVSLNYLDVKYYKVSCQSKNLQSKKKKKRSSAAGGSSQQPALQANRFIRTNIQTVQKDLAFTDFTPADLTECHGNTHINKRK